MLIVSEGTGPRRPIDQLPAKRRKRDEMLRPHFHVLGPAQDTVAKGEHEEREDDDQIIEGPDAEDPPHPEGPQIDSAPSRLLAEKQSRDEEPAQEEEDLDTDPSVADDRLPQSFRPARRRPIDRVADRIRPPRPGRERPGGYRGGKGKPSGSRRNAGRRARESRRGRPAPRRPSSVGLALPSLGGPRPHASARASAIGPPGPRVSGAGRGGRGGSCGDPREGNEGHWRRSGRRGWSRRPTRPRNQWIVEAPESSLKPTRYDRATSRGPTDDLLRRPKSSTSGSGPEPIFPSIGSGSKSETAIARKTTSIGARARRSRSVRE